MGDASRPSSIDDRADATATTFSSSIPTVGRVSPRDPSVGIPNIGSAPFTMPSIGAAIRPDSPRVNSRLAGGVTTPPGLPAVVIPGSSARSFGLGRLGLPLLALALGVGGFGLLAAVLDDDPTPPDMVATSSASAVSGASGQVGPAPAGGPVSGDPSMRWAVGSGGNTPVCLVAVVDRGVGLRNRDSDGRLVTEFSEGVQAIGVVWGLVTFDTSPSTVIDPSTTSAGQIGAAMAGIGASPQPFRGLNSMRAGLTAANDALDRCPTGHLPMSLLITDEPPMAAMRLPERFGVVVTPEHADVWRRELGSPAAVSELSSFGFGGPGDAIAEQLRALGLTVDVEVDESTQTSPGGP